MRRLIQRLQAVCFFSTVTFNTYDKQLKQFVRKQLGRRHYNLSLYRQAMTHRSCPQERSHRFACINERLEYLGDAVLDLCVAELLFRTYPMEEEGMLTNMRSKIVNTAHLARIAEQMQLATLLRYRGDALSQNVIGSALEAFIGAIYLDQGYDTCRRFVQDRLLTTYTSLEELRKQIFNYKGIVVEWAQQTRKQLYFEIVRAQHTSLERQFQATLYVENKALAAAFASSKKEAQQQAAKLVCAQLKLS